MCPRASTPSLERLNKEVKRRADVVGIFPNEDSIVRLIGAVLFEQNDEWQSQHRYMQVEAFAQIDAAERRLTFQVRHRLCPEPPWEQNTATLALRRDAACAV